jgi:hypothetical protein
MMTCPDCGENLNRVPTDQPCPACGGRRRDAMATPAAVAAVATIYSPTVVVTTTNSPAEPEAEFVYYDTNAALAVPPATLPRVESLGVDVHRPDEDPPWFVADIRSERKPSRTAVGDDETDLSLAVAIEMESLLKDEN